MRCPTLLIFLFITAMASAQHRHVSDTIINGELCHYTDDPPFRGYFHYVEQMPEAGYDFEKYFRKHFHITSGKVPDTVVVSFIVGEDGLLSEFKVLKGKEAEQDIKATMCIMPGWKPGRQNGKPAPVEMVCRIKMR